MEKTTQRPFAAIDVPDNVSTEGIERLIAECGGREDTYNIRQLVDQHGPKEALTMLFAKLDQRKVTAAILYYGINGGEPFSHNQLAEYFGVVLEMVRHILHKVRAQVRSNALTLMRA